MHKNISQQSTFLLVSCSRRWLRDHQYVDTHLISALRTIHTDDVRRCSQKRRCDTTIPFHVTATRYQTVSHNITSLQYRHIPLIRHRRLSDVRPGNVETTKETEKGNPKKDTTTPNLTPEMKKDLAILEKRFLRLELEPHGRFRGIEVARQMIEEEKLEKRATKPLANIYLNNWIYRFYSLKLGYNKITDVPGDVLANTLIRDGTTIRFWKYKNPKTILKEMYRYPTRPTIMQERYVDKDQKAEALKANNSIGGGTATTFTSTMVQPLTPAEEELERRMWDPTLFRPKLYGKKARREAKKLRKKRQP